MQIGEPLSPRALFGTHPPRSVEGIYTIYENGIPVAMLGNLSTVTPSHCRYEEVRRETPSGWRVHPASCRTYRDAGWLFFLVVHRDGIDPRSFDSVRIRDEVAA